MSSTLCADGVAVTIKRFQCVVRSARFRSCISSDLVECHGRIGATEKDNTTVHHCSRVTLTVGRPPRGRPACSTAAVGIGVVASSIVSVAAADGSCIWLLVRAVHRRKRAQPPPFQELYDRVAAAASYCTTVVSCAIVAIVAKVYLGLPEIVGKSVR